MDSRFWALEVKPGETVRADPGDYDFVRISQVSLGEVKKSNENAPVFLHVNNQKFVIGTLCPERITQFSVDIVFDGEFQVSHGSKNANVFLLGYKTLAGGDGYFESETEDERIPIIETTGKTDSKSDGAITAAEKVNVNSSVAQPKAMVNVEPSKDVKPKKVMEATKDDKPKVGNVDEDDDDSEDDESSDESDDEDTSDTNDSEDDEDGKSSDDEKPTPMEVASVKKRMPEPDIKTPVGKKAKVVTPGGVQKTGGEPAKYVHTATPYPVKHAGKYIGKSQPPKSSGSAVTCKSCSRFFGSESALQSHTKAKHPSN